jgi:hypothetical protein
VTDTSIARASRLQATTVSPGSCSVGPVPASPHPWPYDGSVDTTHLAVICIDWVAPVAAADDVIAATYHLEEQ